MMLGYQASDSENAYDFFFRFFFFQSDRPTQDQETHPKVNERVSSLRTGQNDDGQ